MSNSKPQSTVSEQSISVPIRVGDRITLYQRTASGSGSYTVEPFFEDVVKQFVPDTGLLRFEDSDIGRAAFEKRVRKADGVEIQSE